MLYIHRSINNHQILLFKYQHLVAAARGSYLVLGYSGINMLPFARKIDLHVIIKIYINTR